MFAPLIYPFEPWRIKHNVHHANTNKLVEDTAWHPVMEEHMESWGPVQKALYTVFLGSPLKLWASIGHWALWHFDLNKYSEAQKPRVMVSLAAVFAFMAIGFPALIYFTGWAGWAKYWLMPWLGYHFWMSTFTVIHHTAPHIPFRYGIVETLLWRTCTVCMLHLHCARSSRPNMFLTNVHQHTQHITQPRG